MSNVIAAVCLNPRKAYSQLMAVQAIAQMPEVARLYINIEENTFDNFFQPLTNWLHEECPIPFNADRWHIESNWRQAPEYDQDPKRFVPIAMARNMALDYAFAMQASHILFVDSDVVPHEGGLKKLLDLDAPLCGGLVPGRGAHGSARYVFGTKRSERLPNGEELIHCDHGTSGYCLIRRDVFEMLRFRVGPAFHKRDILLCDDPAFCDDVRNWITGKDYIVHTGATADHWDNPDAPLTLSNSINGYTSGVTGSAGR